MSGPEAYCTQAGQRFVILLEVMEARRYYVSGRVQGVGFRWFVQNAATALGLKGFTRNLADGRVEVCAQGGPDALSALRAELARGPSAARVDFIEEGPAPHAAYTSFRIEG